MLKKISEIKSCPDCGSSNITHSEKKQQVICKDCGLIFEPMSKKMEEQFEKSHEMVKK